MKIKCSFCNRTTTKGVGEASGFGRIKGRIGSRELKIISCPDHSDEAFAEMSKFLKLKKMS